MWPEIKFYVGVEMAAAVVPCKRGQRLGSIPVFPLTSLQRNEACFSHDLFRRGSKYKGGSRSTWFPERSVQVPCFREGQEESK